MESEGSLLFTHLPTTSPYPESDEPDPYLPNSF